MRAVSLCLCVLCRGIVPNMIGAAQAILPNGFAKRASFKESRQATQANKHAFSTGVRKWILGFPKTADTPPMRAFPPFVRGRTDE